MARDDLSEAEWRLIAPLLPNKARGVARVDGRRVLNAILHILRTGSSWRNAALRRTMLPEHAADPAPGTA